MGQRPKGPILLVEDNLETSRVVEAILTMKGYEVATAGDGLDALASLRNGALPSAIVLDVRMPNMDGFAFRRALKAEARWADIPVVMFSAFPPEAMDDSFAVIRKGDPATLLTAIEDACARRGRG